MSPRRPMDPTTCMSVLMFLVIAWLGLPAAGFSQWLHDPTAGVPRKPTALRI